MLKRTVVSLGVQACAVAMAWAAFADEVPDNYLPGTWATGGAEACGTPAAEHITFDADGTFKTVRGDQPTATGFWHLVEDVLDLHMVSSPAFFDDPATKSDDALSNSRVSISTSTPKLCCSTSRRTAFAPWRRWATCCAGPTTAAAPEGACLVVRVGAATPARSRVP